MSSTKKEVYLQLEQIFFPLLAILVIEKNCVNLHGAVDTIIGNGHGDLNSNPGQNLMHFTEH